MAQSGQHDGSGTLIFYPPNRRKKRKHGIFRIKTINAYSRKIAELNFIAPLFSIIIIVTLILDGDTKNKELVSNLNKIDHIELSGFSKTATPDGMLKLENEAVLVYVKPPAGFLRASHDPRICWRGQWF